MCCLMRKICSDDKLVVINSERIYNKTDIPSYEWDFLGAMDS